MPDDASRSEAESHSSDLDLSQLGGLSLGPDWGTGSIPPSKTPKTRGREDRPPGRRGGPREDRRERDGGGRGAPRDRRGGKTARRHGGPEEGGRGRRFERRPREDSAPFEPVLQADFYPDDNAFKALTQAIKHSFRTFELFEIARLILEKPERWVCVARHPDQKEGEPAILSAAVPDGLPFASEQAALSHVFTHYLDTFFEIEEYEAEPPSGSFQLVHRCGMTGELIGPPNFHRYQAMLREHHASRLPHVPFEKVQARLESVRDQEAIDAWMEKMKAGRRYRLKGAPEGTEPIVMEDFESARLYLLTHAKEKLVRPAYSVRFLGKDLQLLPPNDVLRRSIEALHERQMRFPLETANNLRGRLRRLHLAVYKRGSKGVSFVCAVKRRFREPSEVLAENLADLISFLEAHPNIKAADLPREYLGLSEPSPSAEPAPTAEPEATAPEPEGAEPSPTPSAETTEATPASSGEAPAGTPKTAGETTPDRPSPADREEAMKALKRDLRYLVSQGYVIEYSDGRLQVPPMKEPAEAKPKSPPSPSAPAGEKAPVTEATQAVPEGAQEAAAVPSTETAANAETVAKPAPEPPAEPAAKTAPEAPAESAPEAAPEPPAEPAAEPPPAATSPATEPVVPGAVPADHGTSEEAAKEDSAPTEAQAPVEPLIPEAKAAPEAEPEREVSPGPDPELSPEPGPAPTTEPQASPPGGTVPGAHPPRSEAPAEASPPEPEPGPEPEAHDKKLPSDGEAGETEPSKGAPEPGSVRPRGEQESS